MNPNIPKLIELQKLSVLYFYGFGIVQPKQAFFTWGQVS